MTRYLVILKPSSPFLSATGRASDLFFRSDTLSAALVSILAQSGTDVDQADVGGESIASNPPFRVSSALPVIRGPNGSFQVLLPVPQIVKMRFQQVGQRKKWRGLLYADRTWLSSVLGREEPSAGEVLLEEGSRLVLRQANGSGPGKTLAVVSERTSLAVDRQTDGPAESFLFEMMDVHWVDPDFRLGVVVVVEDPAWLETVQSALRLLGLTGVGPKKTSGRGQFSLDGVVPDEPEDMGQERHLLLSLYHPTRQEFSSLRQSWYRLVQRSGYVTSPGAMTLRRCRVTMVEEGAVLAKQPIPRGDVVEVLRPSGNVPGLRHSVYRDGRAVTIGIPFALE